MNLYFTKREKGERKSKMTKYPKNKTYLIMVYSTKKTKTPRKGFYVKATNIFMAKLRAEVKLNDMGKRYGKIKVLPTLKLK